ncbi:MAG TPA: hypothetical protein VIW01_11790 [Dehalococcoidia bacterium]
MQRFRSYGPAGVLLPLFVLVLATLGAAGVSTASADTPTPSASPTPTASASPTPYPQSLITVRFVRDGEPLSLFFGSFPNAVLADGVECFIVTTDGEGSEFSMAWPRKPRSVQPPSCSKGPPTTVRIDFGGSFVVDVLWEGEDITLDAEVPSNFPTIAPLPSPTPTGTANALPDTGGQPEGASRQSEIALAMIGAIAAAAAAAAAAAVRRST